jgi:predicted nucleotidyltransferase
MDERTRALIERVADELAALPGMVAVALGGSHARGTARPDSDVDLGLYYRERAPFAVASVRALARRLSDSPDPTVTDFYGWGPWVNGGAWLTVEGQRIDFLYRNVDQVRRTIAECQAGESKADYHQQATYGFHSQIYLGELEACVPLADPDGVLAELKAAVAVYPPALRRRQIDAWLWYVDFTVRNAAPMAARGDVYNTVGCLTRAASALTQALFALNETYFVSDKGALAAIEGFALRPDGYAAEVEAILAGPHRDAAELTAGVERLGVLWRRVVTLAPGYTPRF